MGGRQLTLGPLIDALAEQRRSLVAFDMPAHGFSGGDWGLHPQAGDAVLAVAAAIGPIDAIVGHSSGASIAALAIREGLTVARAVLIAHASRQSVAANRGVPRIFAGCVLRDEFAGRVQSYSVWRTHR
jgi:pimeloyl-ACP methyl ester carboxylesterase